MLSKITLGLVNPRGGLCNKSYLLCEGDNPAKVIVGGPIRDYLSSVQRKSCKKLVNGAWVTVADLNERHLWGTATVTLKDTLWYIAGYANLYIPLLGTEGEVN